MLDKKVSPIFERILGDMVIITVVDIVAIGDFKMDDREQMKHENKTEANSLNI